VVVAGTSETSETEGHLWEAWPDSPPGREVKINGKVVMSQLECCWMGIVISVVDRARLELASATGEKKGQSLMQREIHDRSRSIVGLLTKNRHNAL
jgi:hypothetical protein